MRLRLAVLVIASRGFPYDEMKQVWLSNWACCAPQGTSLHFLYNTGPAGHQAIPGLDRAYDFHSGLADSETLIPGALDKTMAALSGLPQCREASHVYRSNLSSFVDLRRLSAFAQQCPSRLFASGCSPDRTHLCGAGLLLSADLVQYLCVHVECLDRSVIDDLALSRALFSVPGFQVHWAARVDFVYASSVETHNLHEPLYHYRCKHYDRRKDLQVLRSLLQQLCGGPQHAVAGVGDQQLAVVSEQGAESLPGSTGAPDGAVVVVEHDEVAAGHHA